MQPVQLFGIHPHLFMVSMSSQHYTNKINSIMTDQLSEQLAQEISRIQQLDLAEQPSAFDALRQQLEQVINAADASNPQGS